jgi:hypothetical protein
MGSEIAGDFQIHQVLAWPGSLNWAKSAFIHARKCVFLPIIHERLDLLGNWLEVTGI